MKNFKQTVLAAVLGLSICSSVFAGDISGGKAIARDGDISGGKAIRGDISGGLASPGDISGGKLTVAGDISGGLLQLVLAIVTSR